MRGVGTPPYELTIIRLAQRYHKLPSEVLREPIYWLEYMLTVENLDTKREKRELAKNKSK